ncbi:MAG: hydroxyacid dehydrogenase [Nitrospinota bacterium]
MRARPVFFIPEFREPREGLRELLAPHGEIREGGGRKWSEEELVREARHWDAILVTSREQVTARVIGAADRLKIIAKIGVGVENIDIPAATRCGVAVVNCPGSNATSVAEMALGLILAAVRQIPQGMQSLKEGRWRDQVRIRWELTGAVFGIVGFGNVGRQLARLLRGFEGRILACDAFLPPERVRAGGAEPVDLDTLTRESDVISIHCSLTPETRHMFGAARLRMMKRGAVIVNCARGAVIDEGALAEALREGVIAGAGLDVFEEEPAPKDNPLFGLPNVVFTPHQAGATFNARDRINQMAAESVLRALRGERLDPAMLLNPEVYGS